MTAMRPVSSPVNGSRRRRRPRRGRRRRSRGRGGRLDGLLGSLLGLGRGVLAQDLALLLLRGDRGLLGRGGGVDDGGRRGSRRRGRAGAGPGTVQRRPGPGPGGNGSGVSATGAGRGRGLGRRRRRDRLGRGRVGDAGLRAGGGLAHARRAPARRRSRRHDEGAATASVSAGARKQPPRAARERVVRHSVSSLGAPVLGESATLFGIRAAASGSGGMWPPVRGTHRPDADGNLSAVESRARNRLFAQVPHPKG